MYVDFCNEVLERWKVLARGLGAWYTAASRRGGLSVGAASRRGSGVVGPRLHRSSGVFPAARKAGCSHPWFGRLLLCTTDDIAAIE